VKTVERTRSGRAQALRASRAHVPGHLAQGWRSRVRHHRPDRGDGTGGGKSTRSAPHILLVDDESSIRTIVRVNLETDGMVVVEAEDGAEALERVREAQPSLVLLDVMMPEVDGWEVAERLARDSATRDIPVVFLSARAAREDRQRAQELGAVGYVVKPFDPVHIGRVVSDVLDRIRRGQRDELTKELSEET
jgi:two-component system, chemotaxis family, chemotaxis protein CheY